MRGRLVSAVGSERSHDRSPTALESVSLSGLSYL